MVPSLPAILAGGFLASAHCIGMCGGFACAVGAADVPLAAVLGRQFVYNTGRIFTYAFLGAVAGSSGAALSSYLLGPIDAQQLFGLLAGATMIALGLSALGLIQLPQRWGSALGGWFSPLFAKFLNARGWTGFFLAGLANGFLPCGLVYSFLALAIASGDALHGMLVMTFFGIGTLPAMLLVGSGARLMRQAVRVRIHRAAAVFIVGLGCLTVWRAWPSQAACCDPASTISHVASHD